MHFERSEKSSYISCKEDAKIERTLGGMMRDVFPGRLTSGSVVKRSGKASEE